MSDSSTRRRWAAHTSHRPRGTHGRWSDSTSEATSPWSVARAIEQYFGPADDVPLTTHRELETNLAAFAERKRLDAVPASLSARARLLTKELVADRDLHVRFGPQRDPWVASVWTSSGDASITRESMLRERGARIESVTLQELMKLLEEYGSDVLDYLDANRVSGTL